MVGLLITFILFDLICCLSHLVEVPQEEVANNETPEQESQPEEQPVVDEPEQNGDEDDEEDDEEDEEVKPVKKQKQLIEDLREHVNIVFIGHVGKLL